MTRTSYNQPTVFLVSERIVWLMNYIIIRSNSLDTQKLERLVNPYP